MTGRVAQGVRPGRVAICGGVGECADSTRVENDHDTPGHSRRRFGSKWTAPAILAFALALLAAPALAAAPSPAPSQPTLPAAPPPPAAAPTPPPIGAFSVTADKIDFYSARYILTANGNVAVKLADGTRVTGQTFSMDVRLNRFVIAGAVKLEAAGQTYEGAAFADFFDFDRQYFVPIGDEPDRWTYAHSDYAHPYRGREMPGDTFFLPDMSHDRVFASSRKVVVQPRESIKFVTPTLNFGLAKLPWPSYFLNFTANPNFAENSLPGAFIDGPYDAFGGGHSLATAHIRYDNLNQVFFAYEQHLVSDRSYLVGSVSPLTRPFKQYNFDAFDRLSPKTQIQASFQESAFQQAFKPALSATGFSNVRFTAGLPHSYLQLNADQYWLSLLKQPPVAVNIPSCNNCAGLYFNGDPTHPWYPNHPSDVSLLWSSFLNRVFTHEPHLFFLTRAGGGFAHDGYGLFSLNGASTGTISNHLVGFTVLASQIPLIPDAAGLHRDVFLNLTFDKQRQWFSIPHHLDSTVTAASLSHSFDRHFSTLVSYSIANTADFWGNNQPIIYPSISTYQSPVTGQVYPSWAAFDGFQTQRSLTGQLLYTPSTAFTTSVALRYNHDFPEPIPGLPPLTNTIAWQNFGLTPYQLNVEVRFRLTPILSLDFTDAYFFNFGGYQKWSPNYGVQALR